MKMRNVRDCLTRATLLLLNGDGSLNTGKRFYGYMVNAMRKQFRKDLPAAAGVNITDQINLYINPELFANEENDHVRAEILEHEVKHIIFDHHGRAKDLDDYQHDLWNIATDITINAPLKHLHKKYWTVDRLRQMLKKSNIEDDKPAEYYYHILKDYCNKNGGKGGKGHQQVKSGGQLTDDHSTWGKNEKLDGEGSGNKDGNAQIEALKRQIVKKAMKEAIDACKGCGSVPMEILKAYEDLNKATVNWRQQLRQFLNKADKSNVRKTRTRPNRRLKYLTSGRLKNPETHIFIGIDESGSVGDDFFTQFFSEIDEASKIEGVKFTIIHSDCTVNKMYEYETGMKIERSGCGGTAYMPAINKAIEEKAHGMIYFGDGDIFGEVLIQPKFPFLWAMEEGRKAPANWGKTCHVKLGESK
jgi:predicted metal-dependent peptidase